MKHPHPEISIAQAEQGVLRPLYPGQGLPGKGFPGGNPGGQAGIGRLIPGKKARLPGQAAYVRLGQAGGSQRGQDAEFLDGPYAGAVLPRIGSVRTVAQGKVGSSFQQGKQVTLARITTAAIPGGHQS